MGKEFCSSAIVTQNDSVPHFLWISGPERVVCLAANLTAGVRGRLGCQRAD